MPTLSPNQGRTFRYGRGMRGTPDPDVQTTNFPTSIPGPGSAGTLRAAGAQIAAGQEAVGRAWNDAAQTIAVGMRALSKSNESLGRARRALAGSELELKLTEAYIAHQNKEGVDWTQDPDGFQQSWWTENFEPLAAGYMQLHQGASEEEQMMAQERLNRLRQSYLVKSNADGIGYSIEGHKALAEQFIGGDVQTWAYEIGREAAANGMLDSAKIAEKRREIKQYFTSMNVPSEQMRTWLDLADSSFRLGIASNLSSEQKASLAPGYEMQGSTSVPFQYQSVINAAAKKYNIPNWVLAAQIEAESGFDPNAKSPKGAVGVAQFMPQTAQSLNIDPRDPVASIYGAAQYLDILRKKFGGSLEMALAAYNWGEGNLAKHGMEKMPKETRNYLAKILGAQNRINPDIASGLSLDMDDRLRIAKQGMEEIKDRAALYKTQFDDILLAQAAGSPMTPEAHDIIGTYLSSLEGNNLQAALEMVSESQRMGALAQELPDASREQIIDLIEKSQRFEQDARDNPLLYASVSRQVEALTKVAQEHIDHREKDFADYANKNNEIASTAFDQYERISQDKESSEEDIQSALHTYNEALLRYADDINLPDMYRKLLPDQEVAKINKMLTEGVNPFHIASTLMHDYKGEHLRLLSRQIQMAVDPSFRILFSGLPFSTGEALGEAIALSRPVDGKTSPFDESFSKNQKVIELEEHEWDKTLNAGLEDFRLSALNEQSNLTESVRDAVELLAKYYVVQSNMNPTDAIKRAKEGLIDSKYKFIRNEDGTTVRVPSEIIDQTYLIHFGGWTSNITQNLKNIKSNLDSYLAINNMALHNPLSITGMVYPDASEVAIGAAIDSARWQTSEEEDGVRLIWDDGPVAKKAQVVNQFGQVEELFIPWEVLVQEDVATENPPPETKPIEGPTNIFGEPARPPNIRKTLTPTPAPPAKSEKEKTQETIDEIRRTITNDPRNQDIIMEIEKTTDPDRRRELIAEIMGRASPEVAENPDLLEYLTNWASENLWPEKVHPSGRGRRK